MTRGTFPPFRAGAAALILGTLAGAAPAAAEDLDAGGPLEPARGFAGPGFVMGAFAGLDDVHDVSIGVGGSLGVRVHGPVAFGVQGAVLPVLPVWGELIGVGPIGAWHVLGWVRLTAVEAPVFRLEVDVLAGAARRAAGIAVLEIDDDVVEALPDVRLEPRLMFRKAGGRNHLGLQVRAEVMPLFRRRVGHLGEGRTSEELAASVFLAEVMAGLRYERHDPRGGWHGVSFMVGAAWSGQAGGVSPVPAMQVAYVAGFDPARPGRAR